jgi:ankyrin repeat protein
MAGRIRVSDFTTEELFAKYQRAIEDAKASKIEEYLRDYRLPKDDTGAILLHFAANYANSSKVTETLKDACLKIVPLLVKEGGVHVDSTEQQLTPLHKACERGHVEMVSVLIGLNADVNKRASNQQTAVHLASSAVILSLLVAGGANVNAIDKNGQTKLHLLALEPSAESLKMANVLLSTRKGSVTDRSVLPDIADKKQNTPAHYVAQWMDENQSRKSDPNFKLAKEMLNSFLLAGIAVDLPDGNKKSLKDYAGHCKEIADVLDRNRDSCRACECVVM